MTIPEGCVPNVYKLYRECFVANALDGDDGGTITMPRRELADLVADLFSQEEWRRIWATSPDAGFDMTREEREAEAIRLYTTFDVTLDDIAERLFYTRDRVRKVLVAHGLTPAEVRAQPRQPWPQRRQLGIGDVPTLDDGRLRENRGTAGHGDMVKLARANGKFGLIEPSTARTTEGA